MHPWKILPLPVVSLHAKPSAFSCVAGSSLSCDSQFRIRLFAGHCEMLVNDDDARPSCRPESRLNANTQRSIVLLLPPIYIPLSPACVTWMPVKCQKLPLTVMPRLESAVAW